MKGLFLTKLLANSNYDNFNKGFESAEKGFDLVFNLAVISGIVIGIAIIIGIILTVIFSIKKHKNYNDTTSNVGNNSQNKLKGLFEEKKEEGIAVCSQCGAKVETINGKGTCQYCGGKVISK